MPRRRLKAATSAVLALGMPPCRPRLRQQTRSNPAPILSALRLCESKTELSRQWTRPDEDNIVLSDLLTPDGTATTWLDATVPETGVTYTYRVRAVRDGETSGWSSQAQVEVPEDADFGGGTVAPPDDGPVAQPQRHVRPSRPDWARSVGRGRCDPPGVGRA